MDSIGLLLLVGTALFGIVLIVAEAWAVLTHQPTISDRLRSLQGSAPIAVTITLLVLGVLVGHFWAQ